MEWSGLVVGGGQINDVEQEGEEELRKKSEKRGSLADASWHDLGNGGRRWGWHDLG